MWLFAQAGDPDAEWLLPDPPVPDGGAFWAVLVPAFWLVAVVLWTAMLVHCLRHDPDRSFWVWILILFPPACVVYFLTRWLPSSEGALPAVLRRFGRRRELARLEAATQQIGNAYHFLQYGDALREVGQPAEALASYEQALARDPAELRAMWGAAQCQLDLQNLDAAKAWLERTLAIDSQYKFGDVSLAYARLLMQKQQYDEARRCLEEHALRWRSPESLFLLGAAREQNGDPDEAIDAFQMLIQDLRAAPESFARQNRHWRRKAEREVQRLHEE